MPHNSLAPHFETRRELYDHLQGDQKRDERKIQIKGACLTVALWVALAGDAQWRAVCIFAAVFLGLSLVWTVVELVNRNWFMHSLTLGHLLKAEEA